MKTEKIAKSALVAFVMASTLCSADATKSISNEDIDRLFISFQQEAREELEKERLAKQKEKLAAKLKAPPTPSKKYVNGREVFDRSSGKFSTQMEQPKPIFDPQSEENRLLINGIICEYGKCVAVTSKGVFSKGEKISPMEKIVEITAHEVKTNRRKVSF